MIKKIPLLRPDLRNKILKCYDHLLNVLDVTIAYLGLILGFGIALLYLLSPTIHLLSIGIVTIASCFTYILLKKYFFNKNPINMIQIQSKVKTNINRIIFLICFSFSLLIIHSSYNRPFIYFALIIICVGSILLSIERMENKIELVFIIIQIIILSLSLRSSIYHFYGGFGADYWIHLDNVKLIVEYGSTNPITNKYFYAPIMHLQSAFFQIITDNTIRESIFFAVSVPLVLSSLCLFIIGKFFLNEKAGLLSILLYNLYEYCIYWGASPEPTSYGICLFTVLLLIILKIVSLSTSYESSRVKWFSLAIIFIPVLIMTHAISSFITLVTLFGFTVGLVTYHFFFEHIKNYLILITLNFILLIGLIQHWFFSTYSQHTEDSFLGVILSTFLKYIFDDGFGFLNRPGTAVNLELMPIPFIEQLADVMSFSILLFFSIICCLFWLSNSQRDYLKYSMIFILCSLLITLFIFPLFGLRNIMPSRWFAFIAIFLVIMASNIIANIFFSLSKHPIAKFSIIFIIIAFAFFSTANTFSNTDSPIWKSKSVCLNTYTVPELQGITTINKYSSEVITDNRAATVFRFFIGIQTNVFFSNDDIYQYESGIFAWRNYYFNRPYDSYSYMDEIDKEIRTKTILGINMYEYLEKKNKIYSNRDLSIFELN